MRTFEHPNYAGGFICPLCQTAADQPVTLVEIPGTEEGFNIQAMQVHAECLALRQKMSELSAAKEDES